MSGGPRPDDGAMREARHVTRREGLRAGAAATLAAARRLAPALFVGCSAGLPAARRPIMLGLLHSQTGTLAISETSLRDAEILAIEEINASGGVLGRPLEARAPDPKSRSADLFPRRARRLVEEEGAAALFGCWTSTSRKAVIPVCEEFDRLLFYPVQYEGNECSPQVVYGGAVPAQQILPAVDWLLSTAGGRRRRLFLVGSDYVFPRTANYVVKKYLAARGLEPAGEVYMPLGHERFHGVVEMIDASRADAVLSTINGASNVDFFAELAATGVDPDKRPVVSTSVGEDELRSIPAEHARGHLAAWSYFQSLPGDSNRDWVARFRREFGYDRVTSDPMETAYALVYLWRQAVERAGSVATDAVRQVLREGLEVAAPGGPLRVDPRTQHCWKRFRLGRITAERQFEVVHESNGPLEPDPFPQVAFPGWSCDWTQGGLVAGPEVRIDGGF
jgi:urea transport system substrate-binding protein